MNNMWEEINSEEGDGQTRMTSWTETTSAMQVGNMVVLKVSRDYHSDTVTCGVA